MTTPTRSYRMDIETIEKLEQIRVVHQESVDHFFKDHSINQSVKVTLSKVIKTLIEEEYARLKIAGSL